MKKKSNKNCPESSLLLKLMIACVALSLAMLAIVAYDKLIRKQCEPCKCGTVTVEPWTE